MRRLVLAVWAALALFAATLAGPAAAAAVELDPAGAWDAPGDWPHIAIHSALDANGKVVTYGTRGPFAKQTGLFKYDCVPQLYEPSFRGRSTAYARTPVIFIARS